MPLKPYTCAYVCTAAVLQVALLGGCNRTDVANRVEPPRNTAQNTGQDTGPPTDPNGGLAAARVTVDGPERLILAFGDSLYAGYGLQSGESLPADVERLLRQRGINATVVNASVSGDTTSAGRNRLGFALDNLPRKPDVVLLGLGGNDVLRQIPVAETRANMVAMLDELQRRNIPVVLTGMRAPPNLGPDYTRPFDAMYPQLARQYEAALDPFVLANVLGDRQLMLADGIHPNARGVDVMAARIAPLIADQL